MNRDEEHIIMLTADIVAAHVSNNNIAVSDLPAFIAKVHGALTTLGTPTQSAPEKAEPAVAIRNSVKHDHLTCLEDGLKFKMLKRHMMTHHHMTPDEYRAKWGLPASYPMASPNYAKVRREAAIRNGLGRKPGARPKLKIKS